MRLQPAHSETFFAERLRMPQRSLEDCRHFCLVSCAAYFAGQPAFSMRFTLALRTEWFMYCPWMQSVSHAVFLKDPRVFLMWLVSTTFKVLAFISVMFFPTQGFGLLVDFFYPVVCFSLCSFAFCRLYLFKSFCITFSKMSFSSIPKETSHKVKI